MRELPSLVTRIAERSAATSQPLVVALDGRSGVGKSTWAKALATQLDATLIEGDDFFAGGVEVRRDRPQERAAACIDWQSQRKVLSELRAGRAASYQAFDWLAFDGRLRVEATRCEARRVVLLEGVYSARPELRDLLDLRILLRVPEAVRQARLLAREGVLTAWELQWHEAEQWYFAEAAPPECFDIVLDAD
ncbi:MAG: uridine kinase family protein [Myxococcota bacterium]